METIIRDLCALFYIVPLQAETGKYLSAADVPDYVARAVPYFLLLIALEFFYGVFKKQKLYSLKDTIMSISLGIVQQLIGIWMKEALIFPYLLIYQAFAPLRQQVLQSGYWPDMSGQQYDVLVFVVGFLGCDLGYYFLHRTAHEWQLLWSAHSVHHSGERYNLATALRQGAFQTTYSWFFYIPLAVMGLPVTHFIRHNRLNTVYQFWIHTEVVGRCHWLVELVMNTASHHRLHHRPPGNCNYAGVLIIWDRLFCTFQSEHDLPKTKITTAATSSTHNADAVSEKGRLRSDSTSTTTATTTTTSRGVIYGLARPLNNYDPVYANICHLIRLCEPKQGDGRVAKEGNHDPAWIVSRLVKLLSVVVTKRIKQDLCITLSAKEFMPDILEDWRVAGEAIPRICEEEDCPYVISYATHTWREMWRLPPSVNEDALDGDDATLAAHTSGDSGVVVEFSKRDAIFLKGRRAREAPALSLGLALVVTLQFLFSLVVGYSFLLQSGDKREVSLERHPLLSGNSNATGGVDAFGAALAVAEEEERTTRVCNAMVCIGCVLLLQMIKFYYK